MLNYPKETFNKIFTCAKGEFTEVLRLSLMKGRKNVSFIGRLLVSFFFSALFIYLLEKKKGEN